MAIVRKEKTRQNTGLHEKAAPTAKPAGGVQTPPERDVLKPVEAPELVSGSRLRSSEHQAEEVPWHAMTADEVLERLTTDRQRGLTPREAAQRLEQFGPNEVRLSFNRKPVPWWRTLSWAVPRWFKSHR